MNIGQLDRQIDLQAYVTTQDTFGQDVGEWQTVAAKVWAAKKFRQGQESYDADQKTAVQKVEWHIRYRAGVTTLLRVVELETGSIYEIDSVAEIGRKSGLILTSYSRGDEKLTVSGV